MALGPPRPAPTHPNIVAARRHGDDLVTGRRRGRDRFGNGQRGRKGAADGEICGTAGQQQHAQERHSDCLSDHGQALLTLLVVPGGGSVYEPSPPQSPPASGYNRHSMEAPLAGILVADLTQNVAGPSCTQILGDMGADVIKVERPGRGDDARAWAPPYWGSESATFLGVNRSKRSLAVDMKQADGRAVLERLIGRADVLVQSLRAGVIEELGLDWERARALNPRLVYCSITAFGTEGPLKDRPGYDPLMQAYGGIMSINGHPNQPPARVPASVGHMGTGRWAVMGIMAALRERHRPGRGAHVTTALFDSALVWSVFQMSHYLATGDVPQPQGSGTAMIVPYEAFPVSDGWVMVAAASDALFVKT